MIRSKSRSALAAAILRVQRNDPLRNKCPSILTLQIQKEYVVVCITPLHCELVVTIDVEVEIQSQA